MIKNFLKELPYTLAQPMFREFELKKRELNGWIQHTQSKRIKRYLEQREIIEYLFALGIYYRYVIAPLTRTSDLFGRVQERDISSIAIGGREIGSEFRKRILRAERHFHQVLREYGLSESFFSLTDVKQIVMTLIRIEERPRFTNE